MKKPVAALLLLLCSAALAPAQVKVITEAKIPDPETRRRLNLDLLWKIRLPMDDIFDGFFSIQVIPYRTDPQLLVQTRSGKVFLLNAETGEMLWRVQPAGTVRGGMLAAAYNSHAIYIVRGEYLDILNRETGKLELYTWNKTTKQKRYGMRLRVVQLPPLPGPQPTPEPPLDPPIAMPSADENNFIYTSGTKIICFDVPDYRIPLPPLEVKKGEKAPKDDGMRNPYQPRLNWMLMLGKSTVVTNPLITGSQVAVLEKDGTFLSMEKYEDKTRFRLRAKDRIVAAGAVYKEAVYFGSEDQLLYAVDAENGGVLWPQFPCGGPIRRKPYCNDRDIFVKAEGVGLLRVDRVNRIGMWEKPDKDSHAFLAVNRMFVYSRDTQGKLLVHDYVRGTVMARYDMTAWQVNVPNEWTDRIYFANHDGQIICMHHHDYPQAQRMKNQNWIIKRILPKKDKEQKKKSE